MFNRSNSKYDQVEKDARRLADSISQLMSDDQGNEGRDRSEKMREMMDTSKQRLREASDYTRQKSQEADRFAHENVWTTVGIAAGVGAILGAILTRGRNR